MMKFLKIIFISAIITLFNCCNRVGNINSIDFTSILKADSTVINLEDISESIKIVPLQMTDSSIISYISDVKFDGSYLYVLDKNTCKVFNSEGKYIRSIGIKGRANNEYLYINEVFINPNKIILFDESGKKLLTFGLDGKYLYTLPIKDIKGATQVYTLDGDNYMAFTPDLGQEHSDNMLTFFNSKGITDSILYNNPLNVPCNANIYIKECQLLKYDNELKIKLLLNDTIFSLNLNNKKLYPCYFLNLGEKKAVPDARIDMINSLYSGGIPERYNQMSKVILLGENNSTILMKVDNEYYFYNKRNQKVNKWFVLPPLSTEYENSKGLSKISTLDEAGYLISYVENTDENGNPIIILAKLK